MQPIPKDIRTLGASGCALTTSPIVISPVIFNTITSLKISIFYIIPKNAIKNTFNIDKGIF
jgi:hypothetical protein